MNKELKLRIKTSIILLICLYLMINFQFILGYVLIVVSLLSIFELDNILSRILKKRNLLKFFSNIFFILYMLIFCTVIFIFTLHTSLKLVIFYFLFICIFSDIGGLLFGKLLKGPKLIIVLILIFFLKKY